MTPQPAIRIPLAFARSALFRPGDPLPPDIGDASGCTTSKTPTRLLAAPTDYAFTIESRGPALTQTHAFVWQMVAAHLRNAPAQVVTWTLATGGATRGLARSSARGRHRPRAAFLGR